MVFFVNIRFCLFGLVLYNFYSYCQNQNFSDPQGTLPTVTIAVLVRNKAHTLPYFLTGLHRQDYPKKKLTLWMYSDYNSDNSIEILKKWKAYREGEYQGYFLGADNLGLKFHPDEKNVSRWTLERYKHVVKLREEALNYARNTSSDYLFMLDADVILTEPKTLKQLLTVGVGDGLVVSPMLESEEDYSNFWVDITKDYKPIQTNQYWHILHRHKEYVGHNFVSGLHTAIFMSLKHKYSDRLTFDPAKVEGYNGPLDDTLAFSDNIRKIGVNLNLLNKNRYGYVTKPNEFSTQDNEITKLTNVKLKALSQGIRFPIHPVVSKYVSYPKPSKLNMSKIFMINLARRPDRRRLMKQSFKELGMDVVTYRAVDGNNLTMKKLVDMGVHMMPEYAYSYTHRKMTAGDVGCFLSHYNIWKKIVSKKYKQVLIMEDDVKFQPYFMEKFAKVMHEARILGFDLLYLGRQKLIEFGETRVSRNIVRPLCSAWALGYVLTYDGAQKLLKANPLKNMLPVDHFLPIMFNAQIHTNWTEKYPKELRTIHALSADPSLMIPANFYGPNGSISDIQNSKIMSEPTEAHIEL